MTTTNTQTASSDPVLVDSILFDSILFDYVLRLGDNSLILGHRLSEWCGHGPFLEEDIGLINTALDLLGQARMFLTYAGEVESQGRSEDDLAYLRTERDFRNVLLVEQPKGDFAYTVVRQLLIDVYNLHLYETLQTSTDTTIAAIAAKALKETRYHLRHSTEWTLRLGDGTEESHQRMQTALNEAWRFTHELFQMDEVDQTMLDKGIGADLQALKTQWQTQVSQILKQATLTLPESTLSINQGRKGLHSEHMGFLLAQLQYMQRTYPGLNW